jgi:predicted metal-binding membrane protein
MAEWKNGSYGALRKGLRHGTNCLGCCWLLMTLSFVLGVMNLLWIAVLTALALVEKVAPKGDWVSRITGIGFAVWEIMLLFPI